MRRPQNVSGGADLDGQWPAGLQRDGAVAEGLTMPHFRDDRLPLPEALARIEAALAEPRIGRDGWRSRRGPPAPTSCAVHRVRGGAARSALPLRPRVMLRLLRVACRGSQRSVPDLSRRVASADCER